MPMRRTLKIFAFMVSGYALLCLPAFVWPKYLDSPLGIFVAVPYLSVYLFHGIGVPGLLQNNGACGWGWCAPTILGWVFLGVFWGIVLLLIASGITALGKSNKETNTREL